MQQPDDKRLPGDETEPGAEQGGEMTCRACNGSGTQEGEPCPACGGKGKVVVPVGDA